MFFFLQRDDGKFVARPGEHKSYVDRLQDAWAFHSREDAERQLCKGNERIVTAEEVFGSRR